MTARDYLAAVQQRADLCGHYQGVAGDLGRTDVPRLVAALTDALDHTQFPMPVTDDYSNGYNAALRDVGDAITDALTPKETDS